MTNVLSDGSITLPQEVRARLGLQPHDDLAFTVENGVLVASKVSERDERYEAE